MRLTLTMRLCAAFAWAAGLGACASPGRPPPLREFDSVYGSASHMAPTERVMRTTATPEQVLAVLRDELTRSSATEVATVESLGVSVSGEEDARWLERRRIDQEEWEAYGKRNRRALDAIVRPEGLGAAPPEDSETAAVLLSARVWERDAAFEYERTSVSENRTTTTRTVTSDPVASEIAFRIWRADDGTTLVYATATPIIQDKRQSESPSLALRWLPFARGHDEAELVRSYLKILRRRLPPAP